MALTVDVGGGTITSSEGESSEAILANIAALDASSTKDPITPATEPVAAPDADGEPAAAVVAEPATDRDPATGKFTKADAVEPVRNKKEFEKRLAKATWEIQEARREAAREREQRERFERDLADARKAQTPVQTPAKPATDGRPSEDEVGTTYQTYADYVEALADWKYEQRSKADQAKAQQSDAERTEGERRQKFGERNVAWRQANPTLAAELDDLTKTPTPDLPPAMVSAILDSEHGPAVLHFLASHPEECLQLIAETQALPPTAANWVRRHLEGTIAAPAAPAGPAKAVTRQPVPAPIQPVGASPVVSEIDTSTLDGHAYLEAENARHAKRMKAKYGL
jgi:hypothetical protein